MEDCSLASPGADRFAAGEGEAAAQAILLLQSRHTILCSSHRLGHPCWLGCPNGSGLPRLPCIAFVSFSLLFESSTAAWPCAPGF